MRKVDNGKRKKKKRMSFLVATNIVASRLNKFLDSSTPSMKKVDDSEKRKETSRNLHKLRRSQCQ